MPSTEGSERQRRAYAEESESLNVRPPRPHSWRHWLALVIALTAFGSFVALLVNFVE